MSKNTIVDKSKIYALRKAGEKAAAEIVMYVDPNYKDFKGICYLTPGSRGHMIEGKLGRKTDTGFTFVSSGFAKGMWEFTEITYENFKREYYKIVEAGEELLAQVSNTAELLDYYHRNFPR